MFSYVVHQKLAFSVLLPLTSLFAELCWHVIVVRHLSLQSLLPCEAASWSYLLGEQCGDQHSNRFLPVVIYRKGLLMACCWLLSLDLFFAVVTLQGQKKNIDVCDSPDSIWFMLLLVYSFVSFDHSFLPCHLCPSLSHSVSLSLPLTISIMLFTDVLLINHLNSIWGPVCSLRLSFVQNVCCSEGCFWFVWLKCWNYSITRFPLHCLFIGHLHPYKFSLH